MKTLVAYFSAEAGTTAKVAKELAAVTGRELPTEEEASVNEIVKDK